MRIKNIITISFVLLLMFFLVFFIGFNSFNSIEKIKVDENECLIIDIQSLKYYLKKQGNEIFVKNNIGKTKLKIISIPEDSSNSIRIYEDSMNGIDKYKNKTKNTFLVYKDENYQAIYEINDRISLLIKSENMNKKEFYSILSKLEIKENENISSRGEEKWEK